MRIVVECGDLCTGVFNDRVGNRRRVTRLIHSLGSQRQVAVIEAAQIHIGHGPVAAGIQGRLKRQLRVHPIANGDIHHRAFLHEVETTGQDGVGGFLVIQYRIGAGISRDADTIGQSVFQEIGDLGRFVARDIGAGERQGQRAILERGKVSAGETPATISGNGDGIGNTATGPILNQHIQCATGFDIGDRTGKIHTRRHFGGIDGVVIHHRHRKRRAGHVIVDDGNGVINKAVYPKRGVTGKIRGASQHKNLARFQAGQINVIRLPGIARNRDPAHYHHVAENVANLDIHRKPVTDEVGTPLQGHPIGGLIGIVVAADTIRGLLIDELGGQVVKGILEIKGLTGGFVTGQVRGVHR